MNAASSASLFGKQLEPASLAHALLDVIAASYFAQTLDCASFMQVASSGGAHALHT